MIINTILNVLYNLLNTLLIFDIPNLPSEAYDYLTSLFDYIEAGAGILANYTPLTYLLTLFLIVVAVDAALLLYHFVMWILKKIPMISVS